MQPDPHVSLMNGRSTSWLVKGQEMGNGTGLSWSVLPTDSTWAATQVASASSTHRAAASMDLIGRLGAIFGWMRPEDHDEHTACFLEAGRAACSKP